MQINQDFIESSEMVSILEQLKRAINDDIEKRKLAYAGENGKNYYEIERLNADNKAYVASMYQLIGIDGRQYSSTTEELKAANKDYAASINKFIGRDGRQYSTTEELQAANRRWCKEAMDSKIDKIDIYPDYSGSIIEKIDIYPDYLGSIHKKK